MEKTAEHPSGEYSVVEDMALHCTFLMERLNEQRLLQPDLCDVDIVLLRHKATFQAHKGVLAAYSPFFHSLFASSKELQRVELSLEALRPQGFVQILDFIYTSRLLLNGGNARDVLRAATVLQMANVATSCRELLSRGSLTDEQPERDIQTWSSSNGNGGGGSDSNFSMEIKQEEDVSSAKIFGTKSERSPCVAHVGERPHLGTSKEECNMEDPRESEDPFNRKQIIVELNLNNQTLNVSKGLEGSCSSGAPAGFEAEKVNGDSEENREQSEGEEEGPAGTSEDEAGGAARLEFGVPEFLPQGSHRQTRSLVDAMATVTMRTSMRVRRGGRVGVRGEEEEEEEEDGLGQDARLEERRSFPCARCPQVFTNSWDMEMHANVEHNYMLGCDKCGTRFLLDSELVLHQQTDCEKNLQVHTHTCCSCNDDLEVPKGSDLPW